MIIVQSKSVCAEGCELYSNNLRSSNCKYSMLQSNEEYTNFATFIPFQDSRSPVNPVAPPKLCIPEDLTTAGVYTLDLTQAMPEHDTPATRSEGKPTGVIFRVHDIQSGNMTYVQLVHFSLYCMYY